jgi:hypothetical protein
MSWPKASLEGAVLRMTEAGHGQSDRRQRAVVEVRGSLAQVYRSFVLWGSLYEDLDREHEQMRERVAALSGELSSQYLARSMWLGQKTRKKIDRFTEKAKTLHSDFSEEIREQGYPRTRAVMANRVSKELGPLRKEADAALDVELAGNHRRRLPVRWR